MQNIEQILESGLNEDLIRGIFSNPRDKEYLRIKMRPILKEGRLHFQFESYTEKQVFHENLEKEEAKEKVLKLLKNFRQLQLETRARTYSVLVSKKGKMSIKSKPQKDAVKMAALSHNRKKNYILQEGVYVPFLKDLGVITEEGKIVRNRFDKFRQINRFLEFIDMEHTPKNILIRGVRRGVGRNHPELRSQARVKAEKRACGGQEPAVTAKAENAKMEQNRAGGKENHRSKGKKQEKINREIKACETFLHVQPTLGALLADLKEEKEPEGGAGVYE